MFGHFVTLCMKGKNSNIFICTYRIFFGREKFYGKTVTLELLKKVFKREIVKSVSSFTDCRAVVSRKRHSCNGSSKLARSIRPGVFSKIDVLRNFPKFTIKYLRKSFLNKACNFIKKETLTQVFSCKFYEISKNNFFYRTPPVAASG